MQRYIDTSFWDDEFIIELDPSEKLMYMYLMTNPLTTIAGVYKITIRRICFDTGFNETTVKYILQKFEKAKKVFKFGEYIIIRSWCKHQKWQNSKPIKLGIESVLKELPEEVLKKLVEVGYTFDLNEVFAELGITAKNEVRQTENETLEENAQQQDAPSYPTDTLSVPPAYQPSYIECDLNSEGDDDSMSDNQEILQEQPQSDCFVQKQEPPPSSPSAFLSEPQQNYAQLVFDKFKAAGLPCQNGDFWKFCAADFRLAHEKIRGINSKDVLQAVDNYISELRNPNSYIDKEFSFNTFVSSKTFGNCLPANYRPKNFARYDTKPSSSPPPMKNIRTYDDKTVCHCCTGGRLDERGVCSNPDCQSHFNRFGMRID